MQDTTTPINNLEDIETSELLELLSTLHEILTDAMKHVTPIMTNIDNVTAIIKARVMKLENTVQHGNVTAIYVSGYPKITWDNQKLLEYAKRFPEIEAMNKVTFVKATVKITIK